MRELNGKHRNYTFRSWVLSNLCLLLLPIFIGLIFYSNTIGIISEESNQVNTLSLRNLKYMLDGEISKLEKMANTLSASKNIQQLTTISPLAFGKEQLPILATQDELANFYTSSVIDEIFIYINDTCFVTCTNKYNVDTFETLTKNEFCMEYRDFLESFSQRPSASLRILRDGDGRENRYAILYIRPLYTTNLRKPRGAIIIQMNARELFRTLDSLEVVNQGNILLINSLDEYCGDEIESELKEQLRYEELTRLAEDTPLSPREKGITITHVKSDVVNAEYVAVMKTDYIYQAVANVRRQLTIYLVICVIIGSLTAYFFAKKNYGPLDRLKKMLLERLNTDVTIIGTDHEYKAMEESLISLLETEKQTRDIQQRNREAQMNNLLVCLLKNGYPDADRACMLLERYGISLSGGFYVVASVKLNDLAEFETGTDQENESYRSLFSSIVQRMGEGFLDQHLFNVCLADVDGMLALLINYGGDMLSGYSQCRNGIDALSAFAMNSLGLSLNISVSSPHESLQEIATAYSETLIAFDYRTYINNSSVVIHYGDIIQNDSKLLTDDAMNLANQKKLLNCLESKDYESARNLLEDLLVMRNASITSLQIMKIRSYALVNIMLNTIDYSQQVTESDLLNQLKPIELLMNCRSNEEFCHAMRQIFNAVIDVLKQSDAEKEPEFVTVADQYVRRHYTEPNLSVSEVADQLEISMSYLSRNFKHYRGIGLLDYIHSLRIQASKKLLGTMNLSEVAHRIGYVDDKAFIRVYKRFEGITPGKSKSARDPGRETTDQQE